jgi:uncharacterized C2H2 Zn-finger protein
MSRGKSSQGGRGIPRKSSNMRRKARHDKYWDRATCIRCRVVFRSPKLKRLHVENNHQMVVNGRPLAIRNKLPHFQSTLYR